jgi:hypothetical protein
MLNPRDDDLFSLGLVGQSYAFQGQIVGFGAAGGEDNVFRLGPDQPAHPAPGFFQGLTALFPVLVNARRVSVKLLKIGDHGLIYFWVNRHGGHMVRINYSHDESPLL